MALDAARLSAALAAADLSEFTSALCSRLDELHAVASDKKALLTLLKDAGCKMGTRQRLATVLMMELAAAPPAAVPPGGDQPVGAAFWGALGQDPNLDFDFLPPPTSAEADAKLLVAPRAPPAAAAVAPVPQAVREADAAFRASAPEPDGKAPATAPTPRPAVTQASSSSKVVAAKEPERVYNALTGYFEAAPDIDAEEAAAAAKQKLANLPAPKKKPAAPPAAPPPTDAAAAAAAAAVEEERSPAQQQSDLFRKLGDEAFGRRDLAGAERWFEQALAGVPTSAELLTRLANCALAASPAEPARALKHLRKVVALPGTPPAEARLKAGRCCVEVGELEEAIAHYDAAIAEDKMAPVAAPADATLALAGGASGGGASGGGGGGGTAAAQAQAKLSEVGQKASDGRAVAAYVLEQVERCRTLGLEASRCLEALHASRAVRQKCTASLLGMNLAVEALERHGMLAQAIEEAREGVANKNIKVNPMGRAVLARLLARRTLVSEAEEELLALNDAYEQKVPAARAEETRPGYERAVSMLNGLRAAQKYKEEGNAAFKAGQYERALTLYTEGLAADGEGCLAPTLLGNRSQCHMKLLQHTRAHADCDDALKIDADSIKLRLRRAACRIELGHLDRAVEDYEHVLTLDPECAAAVAGLERAEEVASGGDGRKGGLIEFEGESLDPYTELNVAKSANPLQIKQAFRKLALIWHPDKFEGKDQADKDLASKKFQRVRIAHGVLSDPHERSRLDEEGVISKSSGESPAIKPFHEYYSINTPAGYTRDGDAVGSRRYDPTKGATDRLGRVMPAERAQQKAIAEREEIIRLKGPEEAKLLLAPGDPRSSSKPDAYSSYWIKQEELGKEVTHKATGHQVDTHQPKIIAQTRYMPLEVEHRDGTQRGQTENSDAPAVGKVNDRVIEERQRVIADKTEKYVPPPEVAAWTQSGPKDEELVCWFTPGSGQGPSHADKAPHSINDRRAVVPELPKRH